MQSTVIHQFAVFRVRVQGLDTEGFLGRGMQNNVSWLQFSGFRFYGVDGLINFQYDPHMAPVHVSESEILPPPLRIFIGSLVPILPPLHLSYLTHASHLPKLLKMLSLTEGYFRGTLGWAAQVMFGHATC